MLTRSEPSKPLPCWYNNLVKEGDRRHRYQDKEALHHAWRVSHQVQHPEAVHKAERGRPRISECQSHYSRGINQDLGKKRKWPEWWLAKGKSQAAEIQWRIRWRKETIKDGQPLHRMYHRQIQQVADIKKTCKWLDKGALRDGKEALIMAAQEQAWMADR